GTPAGVAVTATAEVRCLAGKPHVAVRVVNDDDARLDVEVATPWGTKTFPSVAPGKNAYQAFAVRGGSSGTDPAVDVVTVTARASDVADERETVATPEPGEPVCG